MKKMLDKEKLKELTLPSDMSASKNTYRQDALYQGSISPSTPTSNNFSLSTKDFIKKKVDHLRRSVKHSESCTPATPGQPDDEETLNTKDDRMIRESRDFSLPKKEESFQAIQT